MTCPFCVRREIIEGGTTCGNSFCQEAAYYANMAKAAKSKREQKAYRKKEAECCEFAREEQRHG